MEEKKHSNTLETNPVHAPAEMHKNHAKQIKIIIILAVVCGLLFITLYLINKKRSSIIPERIYSDEEKAANIEDVAKRTEDQGLPTSQKQIDIMKYNLGQ